jgi:hypothetical protein
MAKIAAERLIRFRVSVGSRWQVTLVDGYQFATGSQTQTVRIYTGTPVFRLATCSLIGHIAIDEKGSVSWHEPPKRAVKWMKQFREKHKALGPEWRSTEKRVVIVPHKGGTAIRLPKGFRGLVDTTKVRL